jgi:hypothetical protein
MPSAAGRFLATAAPAFLVAAFGLYWFAPTIADPDLWGHVRFGQDIVRSGSIPSHDTYSYRTAGQRWINHEWLAEVIFAVLYDRFGPPGLIALKVGISLSILIPCYLHMRRRNMRAVAGIVLVLLICIPLRMGLGTVRPQIFTYLFFLLVLLVVESVSTGQAWRLWVLPLLCGVWVNVHGGVLAGIGVLALWLVARLVALVADRSRVPLVRVKQACLLILPAAACGLALLANPYGAELVVFLARTATVPRPEISEWRGLELLALSGQLFLALLAIGVAGLVCSRLRTRPEAVLILSATAIGTLISQRHYPLFLMALLIVGGEHVADAWNRVWQRASLPVEHGPLVTALTLLGAIALLLFSPQRFECIRVNSAAFPFPVRAVELLKRSGVRGNMAVPFAWGEYVIWHLAPGVKVSIDGRRETVYSDEIYQRTLDFERGTGVWTALLLHAPTDFVLAYNASPTANLMSRTQGWRPLYQDTFCVLFLRDGFAGLGRLVDTPVPDLPDNGDRICFPGPGAGTLGRDEHFRGR